VFYFNTICNGHVSIRQLMNASTVANQGLPKIKGCPPKLDLGCRIMKSTGYSQESRETMMSSITPSCLIFYLSASSNTVGVGRRLPMFKFCIVSIVMTFIVAPKSIRVFGIEKLLIKIVTIGIPGSTYFSEMTLVVIKLANFPIT
jgi:hypothetical protein